MNPIGKTVTKSETIPHVRYFEVENFEFNLQQRLYLKLNNSSKWRCKNSVTKYLPRSMSIAIATFQLENKDALRRHDHFNIIVISLIIFLDAIFLLKALTCDDSNWMTSSCPLLCVAFYAVWFSFGTYLVCDLIWIVQIPNCVASDPNAIIVHHLFTIGLMIIPLYHPELSLVLGIDLMVEVNTLFLTLRRNSDMEGIFFRVCNVMFYATWVIFRLIMFPIVTVIMFNKFVVISTRTGSYFNLIGLSTLIQAFITTMSVFWTAQMLHKLVAKAHRS